MAKTKKIKDLNVGDMAEIGKVEYRKDPETGNLIEDQVFAIAGRQYTWEGNEAKISTLQAQLQSCVARRVEMIKLHITGIPSDVESLSV